MFLCMTFQTPPVYLSCCFRAAHAAKVCLSWSGVTAEYFGPWGGVGTEGLPQTRVVQCLLSEL
jgi:hypothetical protein